MTSQTIHATCLVIGGHGVLLTGPSGSGKSDLALRLIDRGATLVSDDYTIITNQDGQASARAPETIQGRIEVRGIGLVSLPDLQDVPVAMIFDLSQVPDRFPLGDESRIVAGISLPLVGISPFEVSAPIKVELALKAHLSS
jgi:serine kinase of HPr protein (carbohydrate metabolism regulator)